MSIVSVDAALCYDRVNHVSMSLVWLTLVGVVGPIKVLLHCLQTMQFFQRTRHGDSITFTGAKDSTSWDWGRAVEVLHPHGYT